MEMLGEGRIWTRMMGGVCRVQVGEATCSVRAGGDGAGCVVFAHSLLCLPIVCLSLQTTLG